MKRILSIISTIAVISYVVFSTGCSGCKEIGPNIGVSPGAAAAFTDSSYTLSASQTAALTTDAHNVLAEEFTGQSCNNCPAAHVILDGLVAANAGRINVIGIYPAGVEQATPPAGYKYDFRDSVGIFIPNYVSGIAISALPSAFIDRGPFGNSTNPFEIQGSASWPGIISNQLPITDSVNLSLQSSYNATTNIATIVVTATYTQPVSYTQNLSVAIVEDSMVDIQEYPTGFGAYPSGFDSNYVFTNVFRYMVSSIPAGDPILSKMTTKPRGTVLKRTYSYKLKPKTPAVNPARCRVIAFINSTNSPDMHVMQSAQTKFMP